MSNNLFLGEKFCILKYLHYQISRNKIELEHGLEARTSRSLEIGINVSRGRFGCALDVEPG